MWLEAAACYGGYAFLRDLVRWAERKQASRGQSQASSVPAPQYMGREPVPAQRPRRGRQQRPPEPAYDDDEQFGEPMAQMPPLQGVVDFEITVRGRAYDFRS